MFSKKEKEQEIKISYFNIFFHISVTQNANFTANLISNIWNIPICLSVMDERKKEEKRGWKNKK